MNRRRLGLIASISLSLFAVATASVTTYAWFQAAGSAEVRTSSSSTTITVAKPDEYTFYAFNGNGNSSYVLKNVFHDEEDESDGDFTQITTSNRASLTNITGMKPGQTMTFALSFSATSGKTIALKLKKVISNTVSDEGVKNGTKGTDNNLQNRTIKTNDAYNGTEINVGWAMNIFSHCTNDEDDYEDIATDLSSLTGDDLTDRFQLSYTNGSTYLAGTKNNSTKIITLNTAKTIYSASADATETKYLFYTVEFSNNSGTFLTEISSDGTYNSDPINIAPLTGARAFRLPKSGEVASGAANSNCYGALSFALNEFSFEF